MDVTPGQALRVSDTSKTVLASMGELLIDREDRQQIEHLDDVAVAQVDADDPVLDTIVAHLGRQRVDQVAVDLQVVVDDLVTGIEDRKSTRLNSSHVAISYAVFCLKKKKKRNNTKNP